VADKAKTIVVGRDALIGHRYGLRILAEATTNFRDVLCGSRYGLTLLAEATTSGRDVLVGERYGLTLVAEATANFRDVLWGSRIGRALKAEATPVLIEYLIKDKFAKTFVDHRDVLASIIEPISAPWRVLEYVETAMQSATRADPPTVWSDLTDSMLREMIVQERTVGDMRSPLRTHTEREQVTQARTTIPSYDMRSTTRIGSHSELVVRSRGIVVVKVSAVYVAQYEMRAVQVRSTLGILRSFIRTSTERELITMSRLAAAPTNIDDQAATLRQLTTQARTAAAPFSADFAATLRQMIVTQRLPSNVVNDFVQTQRQQVMQMRVTVEYIGMLPVGQLREETLQARTPHEIISANIVGIERELITLHREVALPGYLLGWSARTTLEETTQQRTTRLAPDMHSYISVGGEQIQFTIFRTTVPPIDVISPDVGRHVAQLHQQSVTERVVEPPVSVLGKIRTVTNVVEHAATRDASFELPPIVEPDPVQVIGFSVNAQAVARDSEGWIPVSRLIVPSALQQVPVGDVTGWLDPSLPNSEAVVNLTWLQVAALDPSFPESGFAQSTANVVVALQQVATGDDSLPPSTEPQSDASVALALQYAAVGDDSMVGVEPQSELTVEQLEQPVVQRDLTMGGPLPMSPLDLYVLAQNVIMRDVTMSRLPIRPRGPRPSVMTVRA
jgi:hypothetical protein